MKLKARRRFMVLSQMINHGEVFRVEDERIYKPLLARRLVVETDEKETRAPLEFRSKPKTEKRERTFSLSTPASVVNNFLAATDSLPGDEIPPGLPERLFLSPNLNDIGKRQRQEAEDAHASSDEVPTKKKRGRPKKQHADNLKEKAKQADRPIKHGKRK